MGSDYDGMVIRPPLERISSGKVFKPSSKLRNKYWFEAIITALILWVVTIVTFFGVIFLISSIDSEFLQFNTWMNYFWEPVNFWFWVFDLAWLLPTLIFIPIYLNSFEYSVRAESGEASAEIYTKKGIITVTRKHVPLRAITNVSTKFGPLDRLFGIGCVEIETAASRGMYEEGPEEKIVGITFTEELRDYILAEMRRYKSPNVLGTETDMEFEQPRPKFDESLQDELLYALREIRELLRSIDRKLDKERR
ncbi:MAG: PH domain-containing protein [Candidatus Thorarchaeota archaeon]